MISKRELEEIGEPAVVRAIQPLPWRTALRSLNLWYILIMYHFFGIPATSIYPGLIRIW